MTIAVSTTAQIATSILNKLSAALSQTIPLLPKSFTHVLSKTFAGQYVLLHKYGGFMLLQIFVEHATMQETVVNGKTIRPLVEWGRIIGVGDPIDATRAELVVEVTVTNQVGSLAGGSQLVRTETEVIYQTVGAVPLDAATKQVTMIAAFDPDGNGGAGAIGNLEPGDIVSFVNPLSNVLQDATVVSQTVTAADAETVEAYRLRIIKRFQRKPQGGAYADYQAWGEEVAGILNVYPYTSPNPGEVDVYVESATEPEGIPTSAQLTAVFDAIQLDVSGLASRRPVSAAVNVLSIARTEFTVEVTNLIAEDLVSLKANVDAAVAEYFLALEPFIVGLSVLPRRDRVSQIDISGIISGLANAAGGTVGSVLLKESSNSIPARSLVAGEKAKGTASYI